MYISKYVVALLDATYLDDNTNSVTFAGGQNTFNVTGNDAYGILVYDGDVTFSGTGNDTFNLYATDAAYGIYADTGVTFNNETITNVTDLDNFLTSYNESFNRLSGSGGDMLYFAGSSISW